MLAAIIALGILVFLFWLGFKFFGFTLKVLIWVCIQVPVALCLWAIGLACCCTIILIPVGIWFFKLGFGILAPG